MTTPARKRVYLFLTRLQAGRPQILVFDHLLPELQCGIQTPGGTIGAYESPEEAALREAKEETGLSSFGQLVLLAEDEFTNSEESLQRYFFQLPVFGPTPGTWIHRVRGDGRDGGMEFVLTWVDYPDAGELAPHFRAYLDRVQF